MSNPSPPKPWERAGAGATSSVMSNGAPISSAASGAAALPSSSLNPPALPDRPEALSSVINRTASSYSSYNSNGYGASPYGYGGYSGYNSYSSPYNRFGSGYGSMYGGGYGGAPGSMYGGMPGMSGMYGRMGMPGDPNNPNNPSLTQSFGQNTQATFQLIEGIVNAFGGFAQMLESTYMATHSSFFAMVAVAEQFGNLRHTLGSVLGIYTLMRWIRAAIAKLSGQPPPASARELTPAKFAKFTGKLPDGSPAPPQPSRKPLAFFLLAVFGLPYLMGKLIKALAKNQEEEQRRRESQLVDGPVDPNQLEFCRVVYDFNPETQNQTIQGLDLSVKRGDVVAVLSKSDPLGNPSEWWNCRTRDGRMGYLPSPYLEAIQRRIQNQITGGSQGTSPVGSRAQTMTTTVNSAPGSRASTLTGLKVEDIVKPTAPEIKGKPNEITVESFQKSMFNNS